MLIVLLHAIVFFLYYRAILIIYTPIFAKEQIIFCVKISLSIRLLSHYFMQRQSLIEQRINCQILV
jgi:hypothetical protein